MKGNEIYRSTVSFRTFVSGSRRGDNGITPADKYGVAYGGGRERPRSRGTTIITTGTRLSFDTAEHRAAIERTARIDKTGVKSIPGRVVSTRGAVKTTKDPARAVDCLT